MTTMVEFNLRIKRCENLESKWNKTWVYVVLFYGEKRLWNSSNSLVAKGTATWPETGADCPTYIFDTADLQTGSGFSLGTFLFGTTFQWAAGFRCFVSLLLWVAICSFLISEHLGFLTVFSSYFCFTEFSVLILLTRIGGPRKFCVSLKLMTLEGKTLLTIAKWKLDVMPFQGRIDPTVTSVKKKGSPVLLVRISCLSSKVTELRR